MNKVSLSHFVHIGISPLPRFTTSVMILTIYYKCSFSLISLSRLDEVEDAVNINGKLNQTVKHKEEKITNLETRLLHAYTLLSIPEKGFWLIRTFSRDGAVMRALAFHQCCPGSTPAGS